LGDLASSEAARYTTDKKDPMHQSWNQVVHKKAANVRAIIATGLDVLVCVLCAIDNASSTATLKRAW
jgi:hypothetical protein